MAINEGVSISSDVIETVIGPKTKFKGSVTTDKPIKIQGSYEGDINSEGLVVIDETGYFDGTLKCKELDLIGEAHGKVECTEVFKFALSGKFKGDAVTANLDIRPGSDFDGTLKISK